MPKHHTHHYLHKKQSGRTNYNKAPIDYIVAFFMLLSPLFELPQAVDIYRNHSANDVSLSTWSLFFIASVAWLVYGIRNRLKSIIVVQIIYMIIEATVVVGIVRYS
jgi:uncharacterized protein with PQ loop repeat